MSSSHNEIDDFFENISLPPSKTSIFRMSSKSEISDEDNNIKSTKSNSPTRSWSQTSNRKSDSISDSESDVSSLSSYTGSSNYDSNDNQTARYESSLDTRKIDCSPTKQVIDDIWKTTNKDRF